MNPSRPTVLIYRHNLLPISETFILGQANALIDHQPLFVGVERVKMTLPIPGSAVLAVPPGVSFSNLRRRAYRLAGIAPSFYKNLRQTQPHLIHAHFAPDGVEAMFVADRLRLPLVVTLHGFDATLKDESHTSSMLGRIFLARRKRLWKRAAVFVCVSDFIKRKALESGFPADKLRTQYIGIDTSKFTPGLTEKTEESVLFVGRLVEKKGCEYLIRAMQVVQESRPAVALNIVGDGPLKDSLKSVAKELNVRCQFLGARTSDEIAQLLRTASLFCVPSVEAESGDSEGLGMVFLEAQAAGIPVVSFSHGGIPEAVCHGKTGLLAPEKNTEVLAQSILQVLTSAEFQAQCSVEGPRWVRNRFDIVSQTRGLESIYREVSERAQ